MAIVVLSWAKHHERCLLAVLLSLHVVLGVYYSAVIPLWEAHDEDGHYNYVRYLATARRLPPAGYRSTSPNDEMHQPPLYYALAALPTAFVGSNDDLVPRYNPHMSWPRAQGGLNRVIHDWAAESWPYHGTVLAVHVARLVSVLLGTLGVLFAYLTGREMAPSEPWVRWGAAILLALWPQYRFTSAVVNNDILVAVCVGAVTWLLVRVVAAQRLRAKDLLPLGCATGLTALSKGNGLSVVPVVLLVLIGRIAAAGRQERVRAAAWGAAAAVSGGVLVGSWYAYNVLSGSGVFGGTRSLAWLQTYLGPLQFGLVLPALRQGLYSLWAGFGWNNLALPAPLYWAALGWSALALLGLAVWSARGRARKQLIRAVPVVLVTGSMLATPIVLKVLDGGVESQGRILLAGMPAASVLLALGWTALLPNRVRAAGWMLLAGALALLAVLTPSLWIAPAYAGPAPLAPGQIGEYTPVHVTFDGFAELIGYRLDSRRVAPGEELSLGLAWRAVSRTEKDYSLAVQLFVGERELIGEVQRFPGGGALATSSWQPGYVFAEEVRIAVADRGTAQGLGWVEVSFYDRADGSPTVARDPQGHSLGGAYRFGRIMVRPSQAPASPPPEAIGFGPAVRLGTADIGTEVVGGVAWVNVDLGWVAHERVSNDYTVSVQLRDAGNAIVTQSDGEPAGGMYPTSVFEPGEVVADHHTLFLPDDLPLGEHGIYVCLYDPNTQQRLPVIDSEGERSPHDEILLCSLVSDAGRVISLRPRSAVVRVGAEPTRTALTAGGSRRAVEEAIVSGLRAADSSMRAGQVADALSILREDVLPLDPHSLPALSRVLDFQLAQDSPANEKAAECVARGLRRYALASIAVPSEPRLAVYLGDTMADLVDEGYWSRDTLLRVVAYQVWQFAGDGRAAATERMMLALLNWRPQDPDLLFYKAELFHRRGDLAKADVAYRQVLDVDPGYASAYLRLAVVAELSSHIPGQRQQWSEQAAEWYTRYRQLSPDDLLATYRLEQLAQSLGLARAPQLRLELVSKTDDQRVAASLLGLPAEEVRLGPNLVQNGAFDAWEGDAPAGWRFAAYLGPDGAQGLYFAGKDMLPGIGQSGRIIGFWGGQSATRHATYGEYVGSNFDVGRGKYLLSLYYSSAHFVEGAGFAFVGDYGDPNGVRLAEAELLDLDGEWRVVHMLVDGPDAVASVVSLVRNWGLGQLWIGAVRVRAVDHAGGPYS